MAKKLSFIIPMFNVADYIERCICSIVEQSTSSENYELIVVNDGSTDGGELLVEALQFEYPFIRLISTENNGLSAARNAGLDNATGDYIFFVDADDWICSGSLPMLMDIMERGCQDIILFGVAKAGLGRRKEYINFHLPVPNILIKVEDYINEYTILSAAWQGLFKRKLFTEHNIRMPENRLAEDDDLVIKLFSVADTLCYIPFLVYNYYQRPGSISNKSGVVHNERLVKDRVIILEYVIRYVESFSGRRRSGLERKANVLALDIVRLLIRKGIPSNTVDFILLTLVRLGYYPQKQLYRSEERFFGKLLSESPRVHFFASNKIFSRFF